MTGDIIFHNTIKLKEGYIVMILKIGKTIKIRNKMIHELPLPEDVIDRVEHITELECATKDIEFNEQHD